MCSYYEIICHVVSVVTQRQRDEAVSVVTQRQRDEAVSVVTQRQRDEAKEVRGFSGLVNIAHLSHDMRRTNILLTPLTALQPSSPCCRPAPYSRDELTTYSTRHFIITG